MDICQVETGLLRKKPCGSNAVTHCVNCEQPLCSKHAVAQHTEAGKHSGKFACKECDAAHRENAKAIAAAAAKPAAPKEAPKEAPKQAPAASKPAAPKEAPKQAPAASKPAENPDGSIDFTPSKK